MSVTQRIVRELEQVAPRLRRARQKKDMTLEELSKTTGISKSTLSRLESGQRKPSLELLLPVVAALSVPLEEIVSSPRIEDPRVPLKPKRADGRVLTPLSQHPGELQAYKITIPATEHAVDLHTHTGHEWLYVLSGRLRIVLGEHDLILGAGEAAEFDTRNPHWFGSGGTGPVEILSMFGKQGQRIHLRAKSAGSAATAGVPAGTGTRTATRTGAAASISSAERSTE
ncbi:helix-turn-helix domain-containing protein [Plantibacter sp. YIM 135249]|uniref:helix-turn-helix domain-containing protein n=1 Tax=Plantibacter sp. YIM 135249 TaxID=3423918 RepID=UPI003D332284